MTRESGSIISAVSGDSVAIDQSAVRNIDAERVEMHATAARDIRSETMDLDDSAVVSVRATDVQMRDCAAIAVIADNVAVSGESSAVFVLARRIDGEVRAAFTPASAFALGLGAVLGIWIIRRIRRITG